MNSASTEPSRMEARPSAILLAFTTALISVFLLWLYLVMEWRKFGLDPFYIPKIHLPPIQVFIQNVKLIFSGYTGGYLRTFLGFFFFGTMAAFFLSAGKLIFNLLFRIKGEYENPAEPISLPEKIPLYFLIGTTAASFIWLFLGLLGLLNIYWAWIMNIAGIVLFTVECIRLKIWNKLKPGEYFKEFISLYNRFSWTEKVLVFLLFIILALLSAHSVILQSYSDVYLVHFALPSFYINEGRIAASPYNIYTYFPQNLEMLVTWALLLKSEAAAALLIWGFLVSFVLLIFGFLRRWTTPLASLLSIFIFISAPVCFWFSSAVKNDFPLSLFLFAHYFALSKGIELQSSRTHESKRWILLAGILCGAAIGYKLTALYAVLPSSILIVFLDWHYNRNRKPAHFLSHFWIAGVALSVAPWFLKTFIETGNPVYPYMNAIFGGHLLKEWHTAVPQASSISGEGINGVVKYFKLLLGTFTDNGKLQSPNWGPTFLFALLVPFCFGNNFPLNLRMVLGANLASWLLLSSYSLEVRYHIAFLTALVIFPFAWSLNCAFKTRFLKYFKPASLIIVGLSFYLTFFQTGMGRSLETALNLLLSGYPPTSIVSSEPDMDSIRWMSHIINTRTGKSDRVLYIGVNYHYGLERKSLFSHELDREIILDCAEKAVDSAELRHNLRDLGIDHILINLNSFVQLSHHHRKELRMNENQFKKITEMMQKYATLMFSTPDRKFAWYSLKNESSPEPIILNSYDIQEYPMKSIEQANVMRMSGKLNEAEKICRTAAQSPISPEIKAVAWSLLGSILFLKKENKKAEEAFLCSIECAPYRAEPYLDFALFCAHAGATEKIGALVKRALEADKTGTVKVMISRSYPELSRFQ